ncbi:glycosyltransferase family 2 protein [Tenacibaculum maritimum]|uniref:glycosyltransferase family 2 protein n=1 Tax=Tenacibaculum maritimum TaxID=107401 RepID=UPI001E45880E|nr:glycosyltransferase [Tenacibaculum maritimum]MCD9611178.1 glycosyltransferase [Tenacibaculum maritimum]
MISVLIPAYNWNVYPLVLALYNQLEEEDIPFEVLVIDDASESEFHPLNQKINSIEHCSFQSLKKNIGRGSLRNLLASQSVYDWLLFLDCDVKPIGRGFVKKYIAVAKKAKGTVFCGGIAYRKEDRSKGELRYNFGVKSEEVALSVREKRPIKYFFTANFFIHRHIFDRIHFEESLKKYGREDLLFASTLEKEGVFIKQIENRVYHLGIDSNEVFTMKTMQATENLFFLADNKLVKERDHLLLRVALLLNDCKIGVFFGKKHAYFKKKAIENSSVIYLNLLKISYLCFLFNRK